MDFHLTEAEQMLQATAREFAKNEIEPVADAVRGARQHVRRPQRLHIRRQLPEPRLHRLPAELQGTDC